MIVLKNHPSAKSLEGRCLQLRKLSESETPLGAASDSAPGPIRPERVFQRKLLKQLDPGSELLEFKLTLCALLAGEENRATAMVDVMKFPGKTPAYYYARAAIALKRGQKETAQKYLENVKKYYSDEQCAYFAQSLKEIDFTAPNPTQPVKMEQPQ